MTPRQPVGRTRSVVAAKSPAPKKDAAGASVKKGRVRYQSGALNDFPTKLPHETFALILDIGANVGATTQEFAAAYPSATVWAFEPIRASYDALVAGTAGIEAVRPVRVAFGAAVAAGVMTSAGTSPGNKLVAGAAAGAGREEVSVVAGDDFCAAESIEHVDFLKIDTVGSDLAVLRGFHGMLGAGAIGVIQVEAGIYPDNRRQVSLERLRGYLEPLDYHLFGVYGQARGFEGKPVLARLDAVFISSAVVERNTGAR